MNANDCIIEHDIKRKACRLVFFWRGLWMRTLPVIVPPAGLPHWNQLLEHADVYEPVMRHELPAQLLTA